MVNEKSAGVIIFLKDNGIKYLILKYGWGHWGFVKGNIEIGEDEIDAALRETSEESGISDLKFIDGFKVSESYKYKLQKKLVNKEVIYFLAETKTKEIKLSKEHTDYKWLDLKSALDYLNFKQQKDLLIKADEFLKSKI